MTFIIFIIGLKMMMKTIDKKRKIQKKKKLIKIKVLKIIETVKKNIKI